MANTYKLGSVSPSISLAVDVNTIAPAATRANVKKTGAPDGGIAVAHSKDATGDVQAEHIGSSTTLNGKTVVIATSIHLFGDATARQVEFNRLNAQYIINGGQDGLKVYTKPDLKIDQNGDHTNIMLITDINLTT
jgi:hypothetical protein